MKSMTGFGSFQARSDYYQISVMVKSVNGRFLEVRSHLPREYYPFEQQLKKHISKLFCRGTVDVYVNRQGRGAVNVVYSEESARKWMTAYEKLAKKLNFKFDKNIFAEKFTSLPHVFSVHESLAIGAAEQRDFQKCFQQALKMCQAERVREGQSLKAHLTTIIKRMVDVVLDMQALRKKLNSEYSHKFKQKLNKLGLEGQVDPSRFTQELILYLDKGDISEEIERLKEHVQACQKYLSTSDEQGKKLDFYSQELLREVNTIGSKANNAQMTELVVTAKGLVEAFKEQVQNIE